jgi:type II secretory pathway component PulJ
MYRGPQLNSRGVTLLELVIYIALTAMVIVLISSPFKGMLKSSAASKQVTRMQSTSRDALAMMSREIRNTGLKRYSFAASDTFNSTIIPKTYLSTDSSSFTLKQGNPGDTLIVYKATIDDAGLCTGGVDSVKFYLKADTLKRNYNGAEIVLGYDFYALQFKTGLLAKDSLLFNASPITVAKWTGSGVNSVLAMNGTGLSIACSGAGSGTVTSVNTLSVSPAARIELHFNIRNITGIPEKVDSLQWLVLNSSSTVVASENSKPGLTSADLIIPVPSAVSGGKIQIKTVCNGAATFVLDSLEIRTVDRGAIIWSDTVAVKDKKYVKALKVFLLQRTHGKSDSQTSTAIDVANVTISRSGAYSWRLLSETVEILNNGLF